jgi:hypothetical protein
LEKPFQTGKSRIKAALLDKFSLLAYDGHYIDKYLFIYGKRAFGPANNGIFFPFIQNLQGDADENHGSFKAEDVFFV